MSRDIEGSGWLRTALGSSTATYILHLHDDATDVSNGQARGHLMSDVAMMVEARSAKRATLVLESGSSAVIEIEELTPDGLQFRFVEGRAVWQRGSRW